MAAAASTASAAAVLSKAVRRQCSQGLGSTNQTTGKTAPLAALARQKEDLLDGWTLCDTTDEAEGGLGWVFLSTSTSDGDEAGEDVLPSPAASLSIAPGRTIDTCSVEDESEGESEADEELRPHGAETLSEVAAAMAPPVPMRARVKAASKAATAQQKSEAQIKKDLARAARKNIAIQQKSSQDMRRQCLRQTCRQ